MPLTPLPGSTRLRAYQLGIESVFTTQVAATRRMPWAFAPDVNPNWTFPTADTGTLAQAIAPYRTALDVTGTATGQLFANDVPALMAASLKGGVSPSTVGGTGKSWVWEPATGSQDVFDTFTGEWFDDATADAWAGTGGIITGWTLTYPQNLGPIELSATYRYATAVYPAAPTGALVVDSAPTPLYMADTELYINDTAGAIGTTVISDTLYDASISYEGNIDVKRFANGNSIRFDIQNYGRGERVVQFTINGTKNASMVAEAVKWIGVNPTERFMELRTTAVPFAGSGQPYSMSVRIPGYWITRAETTISNNTGFSLTGHNIVNTTLGYDFRVACVNQMSAAV